MEIPDGFMQANLVFAGSVVPLGAEVTLGFDRGATTETPDEMAGALYAAFDDCVEVWGTQDLTFAAVEVKFGPSETGASGSFTGSATGSQSGDSVSPNVALLARKSTELGGRKGRGRSFLPGAPEAVIGGNGVLDGTYRAAVQSELDEALATLLLFGIQFVLLHSDATTPTPVETWLLDQRVATQRRRLRR